MKIKALSYQSLADIALQQYGAIDAMIDLALVNGMSITAQPEPGQEIVLPENLPGDEDIAAYFAVRQIKPASLQDIAPGETSGTFFYEPLEAKNTLPDNQVIALQGQSLPDLCLQKTGGLDALIDFALANGKSITAIPQPGEKLTVPKGAALNNRILAYYKAYKIKPAGGFDAPEIEELTLFEAGLFENGLFE